MPVLSFAALMAGCGTLKLNEACLPGSTLLMSPRPTVLQKGAFELQEVEPPGNVVSDPTA